MGCHIFHLDLSLHWRLSGIGEQERHQLNEQSNIYQYEYLSAITLHGPGYLLAGICWMRLYT
jgi:hypothetical protein